MLPVNCTTRFLVRSQPCFSPHSPTPPFGLHHSSHVCVSFGQASVCKVSTMHAYPLRQQAVPTASGFTWQQCTGHTLRSGERCSLPARALRRVVFPEPGGPSSRVILPCRPADTPSGGGAAAGCKGVCPAADTKRPGTGLACQLNGLSSHT